MLNYWHRCRQTKSPHLCSEYSMPFNQSTTSLSLLFARLKVLWGLSTESYLNFQNHRCNRDDRLPLWVRDWCVPPQDWEVCPTDPAMAGTLHTTGEALVIAGPYLILPLDPNHPPHKSEHDSCIPQMKNELLTYFLSFTTCLFKDQPIEWSCRHKNQSKLPLSWNHLWHSSYPVRIVPLWASWSSYIRWVSHKLVSWTGFTKDRCCLAVPVGTCLRVVSMVATLDQVRLNAPNLMWR